MLIQPKETVLLMLIRIPSLKNPYICHWNHYATHQSSVFLNIFIEQVVLEDLP